MRERDVENRLNEKIKTLGGLCLKWTSPGHTGVPDRIVFLPGGRIYFVELKAPGKRPRPRQDFMARELLAQGHKVYALDTINKVDAWIDRVENGYEV